MGKNTKVLRYPSAHFLGILSYSVHEYSLCLERNGFLFFFFLNFKSRKKLPIAQAWSDWWVSVVSSSGITVLKIQAERKILVKDKKL